GLGEVVLEIEGPLAAIKLGGDNERVVTLTEARIASLEKALKEVESNSEVKGLVISGAQHELFCAGADITAIRDVKDPKVGAVLAERGQSVFNQIENLKCTTVAAINGACVGGGCEMVLACDYRIASAYESTKVGLPEIKLGIIPGFGGTQRLPRLVGLPKAFSVILPGKVLSAPRAKKLGLLDVLVEGTSAEDTHKQLLAKAREIALGKFSPNQGDLSLSDRILTYTAIGRWIVSNKAKQGVVKETRGKYPAPLKAIEVALIGLKSGIEQGLKKEAQALGELVVSAESKALVHIYFLTESAKKLGRAEKDQAKQSKVAVIGGGTMGAGIAAAFLAKGVSVLCLITT
ncbi:hypothetical protein BVY02_02635, partial [bacterium J17]